MPGNIFLCIGIGFWQQTVEDRALLSVISKILPKKISEHYRDILTGNVNDIRDSLVIIDSYTFRDVVNNPWLIRKFVQDILSYNRVLLLFDRDRERHYTELDREFSEIDQHPNFYRLTDSPSRKSSNVLYCENFFQSIVDIENLYVIDKSNVTDSYFCLMNRKRDHRTLVANLLQQRNLLHKGFVTYHEGEMDIEGLQKTKIFADLDGFNFGDKGWPDHNLNIYYNQHALELVTETVVDYSFVTEKTMKPLLAGTPFLLVAGAGQIAHLRSLGFDTCGELWDESYDAIEDNSARTIAVIDILDSLLAQPGSLLSAHNHYQRSHKHNLAVLKDYIDRKDQLLHNQLTEIIENLC